MAGLTLAGLLHRALAAAALVVLAVTPACTFVQPETGDRLTACVDGDSDPNVKVSFAKDIRPIINGLVPGPKPCANCHFPNSGTHEGFDQTGLDLTTLRWVRRGGSRTADDIIVPGQPCKSAIIQKLRGTYQEGGRMPKGGPYWTPAQIQLFMDWISEGAQGDDKE